MATSANKALRSSGDWLQQMAYWLLSTIGFGLGLGVKFWAGLILGGLLLWYGLPNLLYWNSGSPGTATTGPGHYTPLPPARPGPVAVPTPSRQGQGTVMTIPAVPAPEMQGIEPPKPLPPLPDTPLGVVRGYKPPLPPPSNWPF